MCKELFYLFKCKHLALRPLKLRVMLALRDSFQGLVRTYQGALIIGYYSRFATHSAISSTFSPGTVPAGIVPFPFIRISLISAAERPVPCSDGPVAPSRSPP